MPNRPAVPEALADPRELLVRAAALLSSAMTFDDTLAHTVGACLPTLGDFGFFDILHNGSVRRTARAHEASHIEALFAGTTWGPGDARDGPLDGPLSGGEALLHAPVDDAWCRRFATSDAQYEHLRELGLRSVVSVPMRYRGELVGALTLFMGRSGRQHTQDHLLLAGELANLAAPVVVNARLLEQHRHAATALRQSEERLRLAVDAGELGIWDWDIDADRLAWSDRVFALHGLAAGSFGGSMDDFVASVHPEDEPQLRRILRDALQDQRPCATEFRVRLPDGRIRWLATRADVLRSDSGRPVRMVGATSDVTERAQLLEAERRARAEAEAARRRLELLSMAGAVLARSLEPGTTLEAIASIVVPSVADWCRIDLIDADGVLQRAVTFHRDPERTRRGEALARRIRGAVTTPGSMEWVAANSRPYFQRFDPQHDIDDTGDPAIRTAVRELGLRCVVVVPLMARGRTLGVMAAMQAESGRELEEEDQALVAELAHRAALALDNARLYAEAETARRQAEAANRAKDEFLAMLGHELRNPLAPIVTALSLMARRGDAAHARERQIIERQVAHLLRLVDDLLDVSRITQGKVQLQRERVDMKAVVARAVELTEPVFERRARPIELHLPEARAHVIGDPVRLAQVLSNLLTNAAKFTPSDGLIAMRMTVAGGHVEIEVADTGSGIAPDLLPRVFDLFSQGNQPIDRNSGGLGLGLAIVRTLSQMHGGSVRAASDGPGRGSRFTVSLPLADEHGEITPEPEARETSSGSGSVLVVDDNVDAAETLALLLEQAGYVVQIAGDGGEALRLLEHFEPELALLDLGLPTMDGHELARRLRADPRTAHMRLAALTGYGSARDRVRTSLHFDEHLVKPVAADVLLEAVARLVAAGPRKTPVEP